MKNHQWLWWVGIAGAVYLLYRYAERTCPGQTTGLCSLYNSVFGQPEQTATTGPAPQPIPPTGTGANPVTIMAPVNFNPAPRPDPSQYKGGILPPPPGPSFGGHR